MVTDGEPTANRPKRVVTRLHETDRGPCEQTILGTRWHPPTRAIAALSGSYPEGRRFRSCPRYEENPWESHISQGLAFRGIAVAPLVRATPEGS